MLARAVGRGASVSTVRSHGHRSSWRSSSTSSHRQTLNKPQTVPGKSQERGRRKGKEDKSGLSENLNLSG